MASVLKRHSEWIEEHQLNCVQRSLHAYRWAKRSRMLFIFMFLVVAAAHLGFPEAVSEAVSTPVLMGTVFFLSFVTLAAEWSTRRQYADCLERYRSLQEN
jgi:hypothetical protein